MEQKTIITIGRQFGSGGHEIAKTLAESLAIPFYDKEVIVEAAKKTGLDENLFKNAEERTVSSFLYSVALGAYAPAGSLTGLPFTNLNEMIFQAQSKVIQELANEGSCVFVGRCADHVLKDYPNCFRIFVYADPEARMQRVMDIYKIKEAEAEEMMTKTDKKRASFYHYYTGKKWNNFQNYDLCLNSGKLEIDGAVETILSYIEKSRKG